MGIICPPLVEIGLRWLPKLGKDQSLASLAAVAALPVTGLGISGPLKILNGINLILDDQGINHLDSYTISLESIRSFRGLLFCKPVTGQELFFLFLTLALAKMQLTRLFNTSF